MLIQRKIKELKFELPPTRQTLIKLFESLNLLLPMVRAIECILHCRGLKMEKSDPAEFQVEKLYEWFLLNLRTLQHINFDEIDPQWLEENKHVVDLSHQQMPLPPLKYAPQHFLRKGEGNYASRNNKIIMLQKLQKDQVFTHPHAFEEYGLQAVEMAEAYDRIDKKNLNKEINSMFKQPFNVRHKRNNSITSSMQHSRFRGNAMEQTLSPMSEKNHGGAGVSHKRYNTLTQKNEFTNRPGMTSTIGIGRNSAPQYHTQG